MTRIWMDPRTALPPIGRMQIIDFSFWNFFWMSFVECRSPLICGFENIFMVLLSVWTNLLCCLCEGLAACNRGDVHFVRSSSIHHRSERSRCTKNDGRLWRQYFHPTCRGQEWHHPHHGTPGERWAGQGGAPRSSPTVGGWEGTAGLLFSRTFSYHYQMWNSKFKRIQNSEYKFELCIGSSS